MLAQIALARRDPLGQLRSSQDAIIQRDEIVVRLARLAVKCPDHNASPSGGYQHSNALMIAKSIVNLNQTFHLIA